MIEFIHADWLSQMSSMKANSVTSIISDPPYNTTKIAWDVGITWPLFWREASRICTNAIVLTCSQPFTSRLICSNLKQFAFEYIWKKSRSGSALTAKHNPVKIHENVAVFRSRERLSYYPQMEVGEPYSRDTTKYKDNNHKIGLKQVIIKNTGTRYPKTILDFPQNWSKQQQVHPTQKPIDLMGYLIKTFSQRGDTIFDPFCGSGTTGLAAEKNERNCICSDSNPKYITIAKQRFVNEYERSN